MSTFLSVDHERVAKLIALHPLVVNRTPLEKVPAIIRTTGIPMLTQLLMLETAVLLLVLTSNLLRNLSLSLIPIDLVSMKTNTLDLTRTRDIHELQSYEMVHQVHLALRLLRAVPKLEGDMITRLPLQ